MEKEEEIKKNLYDLEYSKYLNYLVIILAALATVIVTCWFSGVDQRFKVITTAAITPFAFLIWLSINTKLNKIKDSLRAI